VDIVLRNPRLGAARQASAITQYAFDYANAQLHDDVAALVVKVGR
jgi:hypothetical protein